MYVCAALPSRRTSLQDSAYALREWKEDATRKTQSNLVDFIMAETVTQQVSTSSKCAEKPLLFLVLFCIASSVVGLVIIYTFRCPGCSSVTSSSVVYAYWVSTVVLFLLGVMLLALAVYYKRRQHSAASRVVISSIPAEDLEKTPAPTLHYNRVSQRQQLAQASSTHPTSLDLPDYFSVVQSIDEVCSSVNAAEVSSENVPETPPPSYKEAIEITTLALLTAAANQVDTFSSIQYALTQETIDISDDEIFV